MAIQFQPGRELSSCYARFRPRWSWHVLWNQPYVSGGVLFQPFPELGLTASLAQPFGSGANSFDADLGFSRVPIYSAGINWNLNPRIGLQGAITNGFGQHQHRSAAIRKPIGLFHQLCIHAWYRHTPSPFNAKATGTCERGTHGKHSFGA